MKTKLLLWILVVSIIFSLGERLQALESNPVWYSFSKGLPEKGKISSLDTDPISGTLLAGTNQGIFQSLDFGETWIEQSQGITNQDITCLLFEKNNQIFFSGTSQAGIFRYIKAANKWIPFNTNLPAKNIQVIRSSSQFLYAGTKKDGLFRVKHGSEKWIDLNFDDKNPILKKCEFRSILTINDRIIYCTTNLGLLITDNGGESWRLVEDNAMVGSGLISIAFDPQKSEHILISSELKGIIETFDGGKTWKEINPSISPEKLSPFHSIIFHPVQPKTIYIASSDRVFVSLDDGISWKQISSGLENIKMTTLSLLKKGNSYYLTAGTDASGFFVFLNDRPPSKPTNLQAEIKDSSVYLSWQASQPGTKQVAGYSIYRKKASSNQNFEKIASTSDLFYLDHQVSWNENLIYQITAYDDSSPAIEGNPSMEVSILVDDYPSIQINEPRDGSVFDQSQIYISGSITDLGSGLADSILELSNQEGKIDNYQLSLDSDGTFKQQLNLYLGENHILISARDNNKLISEKKIIIHYKIKDPDKKPPEIFTNQPLEDFIIEEDLITVSGTIRDRDSGIFDAKIWNFVNGNRFGYKLLTLNKEGFFLEKLPVQIGKNIITIQAIDGAGNSAEKTITGTVRKPDLIPPILIVLDPTNGFSTEEGIIEVRGRATDENSGIETCTVTLEYLGKIMYEKNLTLDLQGFFSEKLNLMEGENQLLIVARDKRNNQSKMSLKGKRIPKSVEILVVLQIGSKIAIVNGEEKILQVSPEIKKGKTYIPVRFIAETFGANVNWVSTRKEIQITFKDIYITLWLNQTIVTIESLSDFTKTPTTKFLEVSPYLNGGTTMIPLRFIIEEWKTEVVWDKETQKISIRLMQ
jgi:hypothetical protein